jgi:hypothetical protein
LRRVPSILPASAPHLNLVSHDTPGYSEEEAPEMIMFILLLEPTPPRFYREVSAPFMVGYTFYLTSLRSSHHSVVAVYAITPEYIVVPSIKINIPMVDFCKAKSQVQLVRCWKGNKPARKAGLLGYPETMLE